MKILVINPNTSRKMTEEIRKTVEMVKSPQTEAIVVSPEKGPEFLGSYYEESIATAETLNIVQEMREGVEAVVLACYGDPGLYAMKEIVDVPVVGIAEASMAIATLLGQRFSILVAADKSIFMMHNLVQKYGFGDRLATIRPVDMPTTHLEGAEESISRKLSEVGKKTIEDGAETIILGCAGLTGFDLKLQTQLGVPVIDPVKAGIKLAEALVSMQLAPSKLGLYSRPPSIKENAHRTLTHDHMTLSRDEP
jgi:allantoin racemase